MDLIALLLVAILITLLGAWGIVIWLALGVAGLAAVAAALGGVVAACERTERAFCGIPPLPKKIWDLAVRFSLMGVIVTAMLVMIGVFALSAKPPATLVAHERRVVEIARGENLESLVRRAGADQTAASLIVASVQKVFDLGRMRPGQPVEVYFDPTVMGALLTGLSFRSEPGVSVVANRAANGQFIASEVQTPLKFEVQQIAAPIKTSLYASIVAAGATEKEVRQLVDVFSDRVDFRREIGQGNTVELVFERFFDESGRTVKTGDLLFIALDPRGVRQSFYRFEPREGLTGWYDSTGKGARSTDGALTSSEMGKFRSERSRIDSLRLAEARTNRR